jgi:hypothetical protein
LSSGLRPTIAEAVVRIGDLMESIRGQVRGRNGEVADAKVLRKVKAELATSKRKLILQTERVIFYECIVEDME